MKMNPVAVESMASAAVVPREGGDPSSSRLLSLDALRGFDMFWIVGAAALVQALNGMSGNAVTHFLAGQLQHTQWDGFCFYDLIFPLFLFISGVSMVMSLDRALERDGLMRVLGRVARRSAVIYLLGMIYYGGLSQPWPDIYFSGVLQRIAACYFFAATIYCLLRTAKGIAVTGALLLITYWALLSFVPFPDLKLEKARVEALAAQVGSDSPRAIMQAVPRRVSGVYEEGRNLTNYLDYLYLPRRKTLTYYVNEGLLSTLPAIALPLAGALAGLLLKNQRVPPKRKIFWLAAAGVAGVALALLWSAQFPIIKRIWTSSFVLLTAGLSALLLAVFYYVVEVRGWRRWCQPFVWIGCNPITIYMTAQLVGIPTVAVRLAGGDVRQFFDAQVARGFGALVVALVGLLLMVAFARFLYKRKIFVRV